jgi:anti-sigma factor RsiW
MACREAVELLTAFLDEVLSPDERSRLVAHLAGCGHCAEHLAQIRAGILLAGRTDPEPLDPASRTALLELYRSWREPL